MFFCENHSGKDLIGKKLHTGIKKSFADTFGGNARHWCFAPTCAHTRILSEVSTVQFFLSWLEISVDSETLVKKLYIVPLQCRDPSSAARSITTVVNPRAVI